MERRSRFKERPAEEKKNQYNQSTVSQRRHWLSHVRPCCQKDKIGASIQETTGLKERIHLTTTRKKAAKVANCKRSPKQRHTTENETLGKKREGYGAGETEHQNRHRIVYSIKAAVPYYKKNRT